MFSTGSTKDIGLSSNITPASNAIGSFNVSGEAEDALSWMVKSPLTLENLSSATIGHPVALGCKMQVNIDLEPAVELSRRPIDFAIRP
jgi:hypothetical protein